MSHAYHLTNAVSDISKSKRFYHSLFDQLKWTVKHEDDESAAYSDGQFDFWIVPAENGEGTPGDAGRGYNHLAIRVDTRDEVEGIYQWLLGSGARIDIPPTAYPQYSERYYAVFFFDPDGARLEVVNL
jgi:catechol 2,3-dioxygenase-like lactoylglutathione lyase family enzyme